MSTNRPLDAATVAEIMSWGVATVDADATLQAVLPRLRRIGHEGYPVRDAHGQLVGLLTQRDANRAAEHGLGDTPVRALMLAGHVATTPGEPLDMLVQRMVSTGWGQVPVLGTDGALLGIVTRTDVLAYLGGAHVAPSHSVPTSELAAVLGQPNADLLALVGAFAREQGVAVYLVGGVVRDMLLGRANHDIDFAVEGDAIAFAQAFAAAHGGIATHFAPFGTAKVELGDPDAPIPGQADHVDFVSARYEFYEAPTALPTVYRSGIKLDLRRRDFTINALALTPRPAGDAWDVVDPFGGLADLRAGLVRVLHSLSFVDDPTRILRAARFAHRLGFRVEPRTHALLQSALPLLGRVSGERLRNELLLLLREPSAEVALASLGALGVLDAIHVGLAVDDALPTHFEALRAASDDPPTALALWHAWAMGHTPDAVAGYTDRLRFPSRQARSLQDASRLAAMHDLPTLPPSAITTRLDDVAPEAVHTVAQASTDEALRAVLGHYQAHWQHVQPVTNGGTLRNLGVPPGPQYGVLLARLRAAWLDGEVRSAAEERALLTQLLAAPGTPITPGTHGTPTET